MKKFLPYFCVLFLLGLLIPFIYGQFPKAFVYVLIVLVLTLLMVLIKKGKLTVYDWLIIYMGLIPLHSFKVGSGTVFLRLTEIAFIPLFLVWIAHRRKIGGLQSAKRFRKEYVILCFFMMFTFMSITQSIRPFISIYRSLVLLYLMFLSFIVADMFKDSKKIISVIKVLIIIGALSGIIAVLQSFFPVLYPFYNRILFAAGSLKIIRAGVGWFDPSYFGLFMAMILPITLSCLLCGKFKEKLFFKICLALQLCGLVSSYSRLSLSGFFIASVFLLFVHKRRRLAITIVILVGLFLGAISMTRAYVYEKYPYIAAYMFRIPDEEQLRDNPTLIIGYRYDSWRANISMFLANPLLGVGPFMSTDMYFKYRPADDTWPSDKPIAVHNEYLSMLSERGILGFGSFMVFIIVLFSRSAGNIKAYNDSKESALIVGLNATIISWLVFSLGGASIYAISFWINVGFLIALLDIAKLKNKNNESLDAIEFKTVN